MYGISADQSIRYFRHTAGFSLSTARVREKCNCQRDGHADDFTVILPDMHLLKLANADSGIASWSKVI